MNTANANSPSTTSVTVTHRDGHTEQVAVRKVLHGQFQVLCAAIADESEAGELAEAKLYVADKPDEWWASITEQSFEEILDAGDQLVRKPFKSWYRRRLRLLDLNKDASRVVEHALQQLSEQQGKAGTAANA